MNDAAIATAPSRPITSKARGVCKYYTTPRGCFAGPACKFLHTSEPAVDPSGSRPVALTPFDQAKHCRYFAEGYCKRGDQCWFLHVVEAAPGAVAEQQSREGEEEVCSICFEKPSTYGLLGGCNHIFCISCIRQWRDPRGKGPDITNSKKCPMCRAQCRYIIPSSRFWKDGPEKARIVQKYKDSMSKVPCKHFEGSRAKHPKKPICPFGNECFYQHLNADGTPHVLKHGVAESMRTWHNRMEGRRPSHFERGFGILAGDMEFLQDEGIALEMFDQMVADVMASTGRRRGRGRGRNNGEMDARVDAMVGAVSAVRTHMQRLVGTGNGGNEGMRPILVPGILAPGMNWDLEDGVDNGWGWNDLTAGAGHDPDLDIMGRLERLVSGPLVCVFERITECKQADHMLGSRGRDNESPPPPLEPIEGGDSLPPLEPAEEDEWGAEDEMPALQSVSNSSESEYDESEGEEESDSEDEGVRRVLDLAFNVQRQEAPVAEDEEEEEEEEAVAEPPFVTDGRGRVVWSNKDPSEEEEEEGRGGSGEGSRSLLDRMLDAFR
ncbi:hypothetical protein H0H81_010783 [Sphagnurus paluster]|uniref:RING-type E3 ubiquitin transferase n=1 Tax=Sphagnurus paluster TaxID=117069 RepID=A0A9P7K5Y2_9AGAR|nr:hypothetical protein H0H81_010783 [Sphagnurus paluster]